MIPSDVVSALRLQQPDAAKLAASQTQNQPVARPQQIADVLSNLIPGQRIMADIQALMPNGSYRAVVGQRDITLALPFSAKPGDTLELEVTESDGKLALAFVANRTPGANAPALPVSVSTSLSTAGKVIGNLLTPLDGEGKQAAPAPLNRSQPLIESMPKTAADLAPILKQALTQSGMFYEAHQARWVSGQLPTAALLQEPQGKLSPAPLNAPEFINRAASFPPGVAESPVPPATMPEAPPPSPLTVALAPGQIPPAGEALTAGSAPPTPQTSSEAQPQAPVQTPNKAPEANLAATTLVKPGETIADTPIDRNSAIPVHLSTNSTSSSTTSLPNENPVARELVPLVQQQLNGLATQAFVWQGQVWPGQPMWWEIAADPESRPASSSEPASQWQTRLKLDLPALGGMDITLRLGSGGKVSIAVNTANPASETTLRDSAQALREQLSAAGLSLTQLRVDHG